ncbi:MAG: type II secretion system protein [Myxococcota bacterium]
MARRDRRGMSLLEVMVAIAIMLGLIVIAVPATRSLFELQQRDAARKLAMQLERFHDEAVMRNRCFRFTFYLDENRYTIEPGEAGALISAGPEEREEYEASVQRKLALMDEEQRRAWKHSNRQPFEVLEVAGKMEVELPRSIRLGGFYSPQYGHMVKPGDVLPNQEKDQPLKVYSYVMNTGLSEHTIIWLVSAKDPTSGYSVEVEPLSGVVRLHGDLVDPDDAFDFVPETGPSLPN